LLAQQEKLRFAKKLPRRPIVMLAQQEKLRFAKKLPRRPIVTEPTSYGHKNILEDEESGSRFVELTQVRSLPIDWIMGSRPLPGEYGRIFS